MLKYALLTGALIASAPLAAQDATPQEAQAKPTTGQTVATKSGEVGQGVATGSEQLPAADGQPTAPAQTAETAAPPASGDAVSEQTATAQESAQPAAPAEATASTAPASPAAQPASGTEQVASVVKAEFGTYDADKSGTLSDAEFGKWMTALRKASEPTLQETSPELKTWINTAFASADSDKSKSISEGELTSFLSGAQRAS